MMSKNILRCFLFIGAISPLFSNQTSTVSPVFSDCSLPFRIQLDKEDFQLPNGIQSYVYGAYNGKWLLLAGRTNGVHGFNNDSDNFPPMKQNRMIYVVDPVGKNVSSRSLIDQTSGLSTSQVDSLSLTSSQFYQSNSTLYMTGGYGYDNGVGDYVTRDTLSAIDIPGLMNWVETNQGSAVEHIRQISDPTFKVAGGSMTQVGANPTLLIFGQDFEGYYLDGSNGIYTYLIRIFNIVDDGTNLSVEVESPSVSHPYFRRRDLNIVPVVRGDPPVESLVALSGVFTTDEGIWTVPVEITAAGVPTMADPTLDSTFKQCMNNYTSATVGLFSESSKDMYNVLLGGITFGYFEEGKFKTDSEFPFTNQITTVAIDADGNYTQCLMNREYPVILSTGPNAGNPLLFGAGAQFMLDPSVPVYANGVIKYDQLGADPTVAGYIVGGIQSTLPNTNEITDSSASPYIFKVTLLQVPVITGDYHVNDDTLGNPANALVLDGGVVITDKAVNSTATLSIRESGGMFDTNHLDSSINGSLCGSGPFSKIGEGKLTLSADSSTFSGSFSIEEGSLFITDSALLGGTVSVLPGANLYGTGEVENLINSGMLFPGNSPGILTVLSDFTQNNDGILFIAVGSKKNSALDISGSATLNGALIPFLYQGYLPKAGSKFTVLKAASISGSFFQLEQKITPLLFFDLQYSQNDIQLVVVRNYSNLNLIDSLTPNEQAVKEMLIRVSNQATGDFNTVLDGIDSLSSNEQIAEALNQFILKTPSVESSIVFAQATFTISDIIRRMELLRDGCPQKKCCYIRSPKGCVVENQCVLTPQYCDDKWGAFIAGKALFESQKTTDDLQGYDNTTGGVFIGMDYAMTRHFKAGVVGEYVHNDASLHQHAGKITSNAFGIGAYETLDYCGFYLDGFFMFDWEDYEISRPINFSTIHREAEGDPYGWHYSLYAKLGYEFCKCNWEFDPSIAIEFTSIFVDDYTETGADSLNLHVNAQKTKSLQGSIGASCSHFTNIGSMRLMETLRGYFVHEFDDKNRSFKSYLVNVSDSYFETKIGSPSKNFALIGAGLSLLAKSNLMITLDWDAEVAREHYFAQRVDLMIRFEF